MNWLAPTLILVAAFATVYFEASFDTFRNIFGVQLELLPALVVYAALTHGIEFVAVLAICGGLWLDALSANPPGVSIIPLFFAGIIIYRYRTLLLRDLPYAQFVLGAGACAFAPVLTFVILLSLDTNPLFGWGSLWQWLVMGLMGGLFSPLIFQLFDWIHQAVNYPRSPETSFRADREIKRGRF